MKPILNVIKDYLSDWRNWAVHGLVGIILLIFLFYAPMDLYLRLAILALVVAFNLFRMKYLDNSKEVQKQK